MAFVCTSVCPVVGGDMRYGPFTLKIAVASHWHGTEACEFNAENC